MTVLSLYPLLFVLAAGKDVPASDVYLSDERHRILYLQQGWGELGINVCAHPARQQAQPLRIGDRKYEKGLGHHAPGEMIVELGGEFARFESDIGLQTMPACPGTVVFKVFVDDQEKFDSGVMKVGMPARHVSIPIEGGMELRLVASDAGDGLTCDCANWAEARLIRSKTPRASTVVAVLDVAPFAEVVTCDPARVKGAQATRIQEYRAEDIYLETRLAPDSKGNYVPPSTAKGRCIGLRWLENRLVRELGIDFGGEKPAKDGVQLQCWVGESLWQGKWVLLEGTLTETENGWRYAVDWSKTPEAHGATRKIRWILPSDAMVSVRRLVAITPTPMATVDLRITLDKPIPQKQGRVDMYNGQIVEGDKSLVGKEWNLGEPLALSIRYAKSRPWKTDRTVLRFQLPDVSFGVAVDDVIKDGGVYIRDAGVFVSREDMNRDAAGYLLSIKDKKTVLEQVRAMPDQTFAQAIEHVHNPKQNLQPMLISLACDNHKFVTHHDGTLLFTNTPDQPDQLVRSPKSTGRMAPRFGTGKDLKITRHLEGEWLPAPVTEAQEAGVSYRQRTYVIPTSSQRIDDTGWLDRRPLCVVEFSARVPQGSTGSVDLIFHGESEKKEPAEISGSDILHKGRLLARVVGAPAGSLTEPSKGTLHISWTGENSERVVRICFPAWSQEPADPKLGLPEDPFKVFEAYWQRVMAPVMQVSVPDPLLTNVMLASQVHCLLAARNEEDGKRVSPWIGSLSYGPLESESNSIVRGMDFWGHATFAQRGLDFFINKYDPSGLLTTGYTLMGTGWHLWSLGEHYRLAQDKKWLEGVAPKVAKVCDWIIRQRAKTQKDLPAGRPPEYGLAPPGVMADWNAYAYYFCLNGYFYKGLAEAAGALSGIGYNGAEAMLANAKAFRDDIVHAYHWAQARMPVYPLRNGMSVLGYPSQLTAPGPTNNFFPGQDSNRSWCYDVELGAHQIVPQGVLDPMSRDVTDMMDHMEDVQFLAEGWFDYPADRNEKDWFNLGGFAKVQPYYCRNMEIYALRDEIKPFIRSYFNTIPSLLSMEVLSFNEHFAGVAAWNKTHETGYFLLHSRLMLVQERGDELWLAPFVTNNWLKDGNTISVKNAPTYFGPVSYEIKSKVGQGRIEATVTWPTRNKPKSIALRIRHPEGKVIKRVSIEAQNGGKALFHQDPKDPEVIHIEETAPIAHVVIEY